MVEIKDSGREFHISRPRIVGLVFAAATSPIFFAFAAFGHRTLGNALWLAACVGLVVAYVLPTPLRKFMQALVPSSAERAERSRVDPS